MSVEAVEVLNAVRARIEAGEWIQGFWSCGGKACLQTHLGRELGRRRGGVPTPLDGEVFWAVWCALPEWAGHSIVTFNDSYTTTRFDVLALIDKATVGLLR